MRRPILPLFPLVAVTLAAQPAVQDQDWKTLRILPPWFVYEMPLGKEAKQPVRLKFA